MREWFLKARIDKNLSHTQLSKMVGVSRQYIGMIENGNATPRPNKAKVLAEILNIDWTLFFEDPKLHNTENL